ncbi:MAG: zinc ribbon domain-containing protein [Candidatus Korobacteraceae bacterium]
MEYPCYRCQAEIAEGTAFCPHCGAPQIRVIPPEAESQWTPGPTPDLSAQPFPPPPPTAPPSSMWSPGSPYSPLPSAIRWDLAWKGALLCGVGAALLSAIPIVSVGCCLWMLGAGALSVSLYQKRAPETLITPGMGMKLGALAGLFGFVVNSVLSTISFLTFRSRGDFRHAMEQQMQKQMASNPDPKVQEMMQHLLDWMTTPQGAATMIVLFLLIMGVVFVLFTAAGGALGASMFRRRREFR